MKQLTLLLVVLSLTAGLSWSQQRLERPDTPPFVVKSPNYGDDAVLEAMATVFAEPDATIRESVARVLGETHNAGAIKLIHRAAADPNPHVATAAYIAAADLNTRASRDLIIEGISREEPGPRASAIRAAARLAMTEAAEPLRAAVTAESGLVQVAALQALTSLGLSAKSEDLAAVLTTAPLSVRIAAARNAELAKASDALTQALVAAAAPTSVDALRGTALAALGALGAAQLDQLLTAGASDESVLVQAGAIRGYRLAKKADLALAGLSSASAPVYKEALRAAVQFPRPELADAVVALCMSTPDADIHAIACDALKAIGSPPASLALAKTLPDQLATLVRTRSNNDSSIPDQTRAATAARCRRNLASGCELLGILKHPAGNELMLKIVRESSLDAAYLDEAALALAAMQDKRVIEPLAAKVQAVRRTVLPFLRSQLYPGPGVPFSEEVAGGLCRAAIDLNMTDQVKPILESSQIVLQQLRPALLAAQIASKFPEIAKMADGAYRSDVEGLAFNMLQSAGFGVAARMFATFAVADLKVSKAIDPLEVILTEERAAPAPMAAAAWALQELTGDTPKIPEPARNQDDWPIVLTD